MIMTVWIELINFLFSFTFHPLPASLQEHTSSWIRCLSFWRSKGRRHRWGCSMWPCLNLIRTKWSPGNSVSSFLSFFHKDELVRHSECVMDRMSCTAGRKPACQTATGSLETQVWKNERPRFQFIEKICSAFFCLCSLAQLSQSFPAFLTRLLLAYPRCDKFHGVITWWVLHHRNWAVFFITGSLALNQNDQQGRLNKHLQKEQMSKGMGGWTTEVYRYQTMMTGLWPKYLD